MPADVLISVLSDIHNFFGVISKIEAPPGCQGLNLQTIRFVGWLSPRELRLNYTVWRLHVSRLPANNSLCSHSGVCLSKRREEEELISKRPVVNASINFSSPLLFPFPAFSL